MSFGNIWKSEVKFISSTRPGWRLNNFYHCISFVSVILWNPLCTGHLAEWYLAIPGYLVWGGVGVLGLGGKLLIRLIWSKLILQKWSIVPWSKYFEELIKEVMRHPQTILGEARSDGLWQNATRGRGSLLESCTNATWLFFKFIKRTFLKDHIELITHLQ